MNTGGSPFYPRVFGLATAGILALALYQILQPFVGPILWGILLAFLLVPLNQALRRRCGDRRGLAAGVLTCAVTLLVLAPAVLLVIVFARQARELVGRFQEAADRYRIARASDLLQIPLLEEAMAWVGTLVPATREQLAGWLVDGGKALLQLLVATSGTVFAGTLGALFGFGLTLFLLFFMLRDGEAVVARLLALIPLNPARTARLVQHLSAVTRAVVFGTLFTALIQGMLVGLAFALVRLPSPVVFGVLAAVASLIPLLGTALVWAPAAVALAVGGRWVAAIFLAVWGAAVVSSADNFVRPWFISGRAQVSTLSVFVGLMGGLSAFGPIGIVLGPVVVALVVALVGFAEESLARETGSPGAGVPGGGTPGSS
jgi:predicted PurR-regulated permease PerM